MSLTGGSVPWESRPEALRPDETEAKLSINIIAVSMCCAAPVYSQEYLMGRLWRRGMNLWRKESVKFGCFRKYNSIWIPRLCWLGIFELYVWQCYKENIPLIATTSICGHIAHAIIFFLMDLVVIDCVQQIIWDSNWATWFLVSSTHNTSSHPWSPVRISSFFKAQYQIHSLLWNFYNFSIW